MYVSNIRGLQHETTGGTEERNSNVVIVKLLVAQLCPTLFNPMGCSPPGSPIHGILQARMLEWVAISSSRTPS